MTKRFAPILLCLLLLSTASGCVSFGYQRYGPGEINSYDNMVTEYVDAYGNKKWFWVRGKATGDVDSDGNDEEVVLATTHALPRDTEPPPPIERLILLVCRRTENGPPELLRRLVVFDAESAWTESDIHQPEAVHLPPPSGVARHVSGRVAIVNEDEHAVILVSVWADAEKSRMPTWHAGYVFHNDGPPKRVFQALAVQRDPGIDTRDLDKDGQDEFLIEQSVCPPTDSTEQNLQQPLWVSVYSLAEDGSYKQADLEKPRIYTDLLLPWYDSYVRGLHTKRPTEQQAVYAYYLGLCHLRLKQPKRAVSFFEEAEKSGSETLKKLARTAITTTDTAAP